MAHALPTPPGRRLARTIGAAAVVIVVAVVVVGLVVHNRQTRNASGATTSATSTSTTPTTATPTTATPTTTPTTPSPPASTTLSAVPTTTTAATPRITPTTGTTTTPAVAKVDLIILNNTGRDGLASTARARFEAQGWDVTDVSNFSGSVISTCAFYDPSNPADKQAAEALRAQFPAIKRVEPRFSRLPSAPIVVILTNDYR